MYISKQLITTNTGNIQIKSSAYAQRPDISIRPDNWDLIWNIIKVSFSIKPDRLVASGLASFQNPVLYTPHPEFEIYAFSAKK